MSQNHGAIAAGHKKTAAAGIEMFRLGGNAFDAAVASILASFVVEPTLSSAGGGGFLLAHTQDNQNTLFDFFSQTPRYKRPLSEVDFYPIEADFGGAKQIFHIGLGSMAVPGGIAGVFDIHKKLGRLPFEVVIEPTIDYCRNGVEISQFQAYCIGLLEDILLATPESRKMFAPQGKLLQAGETFFLKDFANTLIELAKNGKKEFYEGEFAQQLVKDSQEKGGYLTLEDLKSYQVIERKPLEINYRGHRLITNPPPSSGGTLMAFALELLSTVDLKGVEFASDRYLQILAEVMRLTNEARKDGYDTNIYKTDVVKTFLASEHLKTYQQQLEKITNKWGSTTHISVIDEEGNAASVTTSNGEGSSYVIPNTGIMINNMLGESDLSPLGFHNWTANQRLSSMMSPTIVLDKGKPEIVLGSGGSNRIRTAILQVVSHLIDFKMPIQDAVQTPRLHWESNLYNIEPGFSETAIQNLQLSFEDQLILWKEKNMFFGGVHTVRHRSDGTMEGAGDPRRNGVAISC